MVMTKSQVLEELERLRDENLQLSQVDTSLSDYYLGKSQGLYEAINLLSIENKTTNQA